MEGLRRRAASGIKWQVGVSLLQKALTFGTTIILARRLGPSVYGLFAFSLVIVSSFELFKSMGIDAALVRRRDDFDAAANTAFFIFPFLGLSLYALLHLTAPAIGVLLRNAEVVPVVKVLGLVFVLSCLTKIPTIAMERDLEFRKISCAEIASALVFSAAALVLVMRGFGIWTLVYAYLLRMLAYLLLMWLFSGWRPRFVFDPKMALEMFHFGKFIFLTSVLWFLKSNLDNLLVGSLLGTTMLGFYAVAVSIVNFAPDQFGGRIYRVMYPAYSKLQGDREGLTKAFLSVLRFISLVAFPAALGIFLLGGDFIRLTYADKWLGTIPVLRVMALVSVSNLLIIASDSVLMAMGRPHISFVSVLAQVLAFFLFVTPAAKLFGLLGVGAVVTAASFGAMALQYFWLMRLLPFKAGEVAESLYPSLAASFVMVVAVVIFKWGISAVAFTRYLFIPEFIFAVVIYLLALYLSNRVILKEVRELVLS